MMDFVLKFITVPQLQTRIADSETLSDAVCFILYMPAIDRSLE